MTTQQQVEASTVQASALFGNNRFTIPDFQRDYSWRVGDEVTDFWQDLAAAIGSGDDYFLGLLILTDDSERREVVDGQQRMITLSLFATALRLAAISRDRKLVAETLKNTFLSSIDYQTEAQVHRLLLSDEGDSRDFIAAIDAATSHLVPAASETSRILLAYHYLAEKLGEDLANSAKPEVRIGEWAEFITQGLQFTVFAHPDRAAAFRVYEVVNTRGKDLTPAELIKSYLIGSSINRYHTVQRWRALERAFNDVAASDQVTTFVRHVVALRRGYVIPRDLYQVVTRTFHGSAGVDDLLGDLETHLGVYLQMIDPSTDVESSDERSRALTVLYWLSGTRFRPIFLAAAATGDDQLLGAVLDLVAPGIVAGGFGTGSIEAQFARAARRVHQGEASWPETLTALAPLLPPRDEFEVRLRRGVNKYHALVLRSAILQSSGMPLINGYVHQIRPRNGEDWPDFDSDDYRELGNTLANWILLDSERRPKGSRTPETVKGKLLSGSISGEIVTDGDIDDWTADYVRKVNVGLVTKCAGIWYDTV